MTQITNCPICNNKIYNTNKSINKFCEQLNMNLSYYSLHCNNEIYHISHGWRLITDLYNTSIYEKIIFYDKLQVISINHIRKQTTISFFKEKGILNHIKTDEVILNRMLNFDYPKLEKTLDTIQMYAYLL